MTRDKSLEELEAEKNAEIYARNHALHHCGTCRYFSSDPRADWRGSCIIELPPMLRALTECQDAFTRADGSCSLWSES
jgi:hypothetical protein